MYQHGSWTHPLNPSPYLLHHSALAIWAPFTSKLFDVSVVPRHTYFVTHQVNVVDDEGCASNWGAPCRCAAVSCATGWVYLPVLLGAHPKHKIQSQRSVDQFEAHSTRPRVSISSWVSLMPLHLSGSFDGKLLIRFKKGSTLCVPPPPKLVRGLK